MPARDAKVPALIGGASFAAGTGLNIGGYHNRPLANVLLAIAALLFLYALWILATRRLPDHRRRAFRLLRRYALLLALLAGWFAVLAAVSPASVKWALLALNVIL